MPPDAATLSANRPPDGLLLSTIALPLLLSGEGNLILYANEAAEAFFGRSSRRIIGESAQSLLRFASDRLNGAIAARESDISAQNMRFQTHGAQANYVDLNISTPLGCPAAGRPRPDRRTDRWRQAAGNGRACDSGA
jgi:nitrogen-specific signal transduction histidine kinase